MSLTDEQKKVWWNDSTHKSYRLHFLDSDIADIGNSRICSESMIITDSLCSEEDIVFGSCCSAQFEIQIADLTEEIKGLEFEAYVTCDGVEIQLGTYFITDVQKTSNRRYNEVTAYDRMYYLNDNVAEWYKSVLPNSDSTMTLLDFRNSFFEYMGLPQEEISLINDDLIVRKTIDTNEISGIEIMKLVCEINGVFGHFDRYGVFRYISLESGGLYPDNNLFPADDLYPSGSSEQVLHYISSDYPEYMTYGINRVQVRNDEDDIGYVSDISGVYLEVENDYIITGNYLMYGMSSQELKKYADRFLEHIKGINYKPATTELTGLPFFELGSKYSINSKFDTFESYVIGHTLKGGQSLRSTFIANGNEFRDNKITGLNYEFQQLKGKANRLTRTVEETISELEDLEKSTSSKITQNAEQIQAEVNRATKAEGDLSTKITQTADSITLSVNKQISDTKSYASNKANEALNSANGSTDSKLQNYSTTVEMNAAINISAQAIKSEVSTSYETKDNANTKYESISSSIEQTAEQISTKVSKGSVSSEISQEAEQITITGNRLIVNANNFELTAEGKITCNDGAIGGLRIGTEGLSDANYGANGLKILKNGEIYCNTIKSYPTDDGSNGLIVQREGNVDLWKAISPYAFSGKNGDYGLYFSDVGLSMTYGAYTNQFQAHRQFGDCISTNAYVKTDLNQGNVSASGTGYFGAILVNDLVATNSKNKMVEVNHYGKRLLYSTEAPEPLFTDKGRGIIENGQCLIALNTIFMECISENADYDVFLTKYGQGDLWVEEIQPAYFIIKGTEGLKFVWKVEAVQVNCESIYLDEFQEKTVLDTVPVISTEAEAPEIILEYEEPIIDYVEVET